MFTNHFGIEMEFTGITREQAAEVAAKFRAASRHTQAATTAPIM